MTPEDRQMVRDALHVAGCAASASAYYLDLGAGSADVRAACLDRATRLHELADELAAPPIVHLVHRYDAYATGDLAHTSTEAFAALGAATARAAELGEDVDTVTVR